MSSSSSTTTPIEVDKAVEATVPLEPFPGFESVPVAHGSLVSIHLKNFMIHSNLGFRFGPRLNLIVGPNGTGKSAVASAICLGLGGSERDTGRGATMQSFVKIGQKSSEIEIVVYDAPSRGRKNLTVRRLIQSTNNSSAWELNGHSSTMERVLTTLKSYGIQVSNLLQYLPQDRVREFAGLNAFDLFKQTVRGVLGERLLEVQDSAAKAQKRARELRLALETKERRKAQLEEENRRDEPHVKRQKDRAVLEQTRDKLHKLVHWQRFRDTRVEVLELKAAEQALRDEAKQASVSVEPLKERAAQAKARADGANKSYTALRAQFQTKSKEVNAFTMEQVVEEVEELREAIGNVGKDKEKAIKKYNAQTQKVASLRKEFEAAAKGEGFYQARAGETMARRKPAQTKLDRTRAQLGEIAKDVTNWQRELVQVKRSVQKIDEEVARKSSKEEKLREDAACMDRAPAFPGLQSKMKAIRKDILEGKQATLVGPMVCGVTFSRPDAVLAMEKFTQLKTWWYFAVRQMEHMKDANALGVSSVCVSGESPDRVAHFSPALFARTGVVDSMDRLLVGDPTLVTAFKTLTKAYTILLGTAETERVYEKEHDVFKQLCPPSGEAISVLTPRYNLRISRSRFDGNVVIEKKDWRTDVITGFLKPAQAVMTNASSSSTAAQTPEDVERHQKRQALHAQQVQLERDLAEALDRQAQLKEETAPMEEEIAQINEELERIRSAQKDEARKRNTVETEQAKLPGLQREAEQDWESQVQESRKALTKALNRVQRDAQTVTTMGCALGEIAEKLIEGWILKTQFDVERAVFHEAWKKADEANSQFRSRLDDLEKRYRAGIAKLQQLKETAVQYLSVEEGTTMFEEFATQKNWTWDTETDMMATISGIEHQLASSRNDAAIVEMYEQREKQIGLLSGELVEDARELGEKESDFNTLVNSFFPEVEALAQKINTHVKAQFSEIARDGGYACAGEVELVRDAEDISKIGLEIKVKFREGDKLQQLTAQRQSGGEKSLCTFVYLLALQSIAPKCFRLVDEINQGLDEDKESFTFQLLISKKIQSQYFVLTPKLVPQLTYPPDVALHVMMNGVHMLDYTKWDMEAFLKRAAELRPAAGKMKKRAGTSSDVAVAKRSQIMV